MRKKLLLEKFTILIVFFSIILTSIGSQGGKSETRQQISQGQPTANMQVIQHIVFIIKENRTLITLELFPERMAPPPAPFRLAR
ncbi:MAG: hypothetical protein ACM3SR_01980 [Ignavibacteriales bacterium]